MCKDKKTVLSSPGKNENEECLSKGLQIHPDLLTINLLRVVKRIVLPALIC